MAAAEGNDSVDAADSPGYAGLLEPGADYGLAAGLDDARAGKLLLAAKPGVAHALGVSLKIVCLHAQLFCDLWIGCCNGAKRENTLSIFPLSIWLALLVLFSSRLSDASRRLGITCVLTPISVGAHDRDLRSLSPRGKCGPVRFQIWDKGGGKIMAPSTKTEILSDRDDPCLPKL
jgi:hypothetical protein